MSSGPTTTTGAAGAPNAAGEEHLSRLFLGIVLVEVLVISGLYWVGLHFAA